MAGSATLKRVRTSTLEVAYEDSGPENGIPVLLMHGFPYDPRAYDEVVLPLVTAGCRTIVPYLRGYGPTRFLSDETPRSGQQAALGNDLKELAGVSTAPGMWRLTQTMASLPDRPRACRARQAANVPVRPIPAEQWTATCRPARRCSRASARAASSERSHH